MKNVINFIQNFLGVINTLVPSRGRIVAYWTASRLWLGDNSKSKFFINFAIIIFASIFDRKLNHVKAFIFFLNFWFTCAKFIKYSFDTVFVPLWDDLSLMMMHSSQYETLVSSGDVYLLMRRLASHHETLCVSWWDGKLLIKRRSSQIEMNASWISSPGETKNDS